jgi:hypothetical protein
MVVVNFDETDMLMKSPKGQLYLSFVLAAVQRFNKLHQGLIFCVMSGTNVRPLHDHLMASSRGKPPKEIPLPLLQSNHVHQVLRDLFVRSNPNNNVKSSESCKSDLEFVAQVLGGVPRYIELLVYSLGEQKVESNFAMEVYKSTLSSGKIQPHALLERVKELINIRYSTTFTDLVRTLRCKTLVAYSLFQWPIDRISLIGGKSVGDLETNGVVFVEDMKLVFPLVLLLNLASAGSPGNVPMLLQKFNVMLSSEIL